MSTLPGSRLCKTLRLGVALSGAWMLLPHALQAQSPGPSPRHATLVDLTGAVGPTLTYASAAAWRLWGLDAGGRFQVGAGLRASHFFTDSYDVERQAGPGAATLRVLSPRLYALNAAFHLRARVAGPVRLGFNLDAAGLSVGPERSTAASGGRVEPTRGNLLLGGRRDRGSLNSELYLALALPRGLQVRAGWSHIVTGHQREATTYQRFHDLAALGVSYTFGEHHNAGAKP